MNRLDEFVASGCHGANSVAEAWILDRSEKDPIALCLNYRHVLGISKTIKHSKRM